MCVSSKLSSLNATRILLYVNPTDALKRTLLTDDLYVAV